MLKSYATTPNALAIFGMALAIFAVSVVATEPAYARQQSNGTSVTKSALKKKGYKCEVVSAGFVECKKGKTVYWCTGSTCVKKSLSQRPRRPKANAASVVKNVKPSRRARRIGKFIGETEKNRSRSVFR